MRPAATLEAGRLVDGYWWFRRDEALHEVHRLRQAFAHRLPGAILAAIDGVLDRARLLPSTVGEVRAEASIRVFAERLERRQQASAAPDPAPDQHDLTD